ncbi:Coiled-coil domain-containing protein 22-like [Papilio machaon]|uniref:Coiled-coil domain-containing protein 22 homolog n=1 Tax=Papilio machaon TaxID=76193 RepID=A0A194RHH0_PAPMA|nr:Coiled-coil domain-containing protein 22-like [Papilio machaon]
MEEVDSIILHFLRQLKVNFNDDTKSLNDLSVDLIVEAASRCISTINPNVKVPSKLPPGVSQRIEVAAQIAAICKDLGYKNDVGYQTFLYYNEAELRQVFMFLIEKLPNEDRHMNTTVPTKKKNVLLNEIANKIDEELNTMWIPPCCKPNSDTIGDFISTEDKFTKPKEISDVEIMEKLQKLNEITKKSTTAMQQKTDNIVTEKKVEIKKSLKELKETAFVLRQKLDTLESERNIMDVEYSQATKFCEKAEADLRNVENILRDIGISDIEDGTIEDKLDKVRKNINALHSKSENLTSKNLGLKVEIDKVKSATTLSESERSKCRNILVNLKETAKALKDECEKKEELSKQLKIKYEKLKGGNKRHVYTERILEIIGNVEKQNLEIGNILQDTRKIQKEINTLEGQLDRCFSIADETLFKDAKKDDQAKKAYKLLALLHSECNSIVSLVNDTGNLARDIVDLEDNIKAEKSKRTEDILEKIQLDLTKLQKESL